MNSYLRSCTAAAAATAFTLLLGLAADAQVGITINGNGVDVSPSPIVQDGRVFVPLRGVFEHLGATVVYSNGQITATGDGHAISLDIGSTQATVDQQSETIDVAPFIIGASTYVPLRFVSQALGAGVTWDGNDRIVQISLNGAPQYQAAAQQNYEQDGDWVDAPPPPIPYYELPPVPDPNEIWVPGYWAWGEGGYYWVPGFWAQPPQTGYYWTPGYWAANNGSFVWHLGYWGLSIGFYGGINYGAGYYGHGYVGGRWSGNTFRYNTAVTPVNVTIIKNVYVDRTVVINNTTANRISYNGAGGVRAQPTSTELVAARAPHKAMTSQQRQHVQVAGQDRSLLATVNGGKPPVTAVAHPFTAAAKPAGFVPVTPSDRAAAQKLVKQPATAPARPAYAHPAAAPPAHAAAVAHPAAAPVAHPAAAAAHPAPPVAHPAARAAPVVHPAAQAPVAHPAARVAPVAPAVPVAHPAAPAPVYVHHAPPIAPRAAPVRPAAVPVVHQAAPVPVVHPAAPAPVVHPAAAAPVVHPAAVRGAPAHPHAAGSPHPPQ